MSKAQSSMSFLVVDWRESLSLSEMHFLISPGEYESWSLFKESSTKSEVRNGCYY